MEKKNQIAQPVTDTDIKPEIPAETKEKPLNQKERLERIESQLAQADQNFKTIGDFLTKLEPVLSLAKQIEERQKAISQQEPPPQGKPSILGGGDIGSILSVVKEALSSGTSSSNNPMVEKLMEKVVEAGLAQMTAGTNLLGAVQKKILMDIGTKIASDTTASIQAT